MASLGVIQLGNYSATNSTMTGVVGTQPVLNNITTPVDTSYLHDTNAGSTTTVVAWFPLDNMPSDFQSMDTLSVQIRYHRPAYDALKTVSSITATVFTADGGATALTGTATLASNVTNTAATNSAVVNFSGLVASNKTTWDGAWLRISYNQSKSKAGSSDSVRVTAAQLTGTYTQVAVPDIWERTGSLSGTSTVTADGNAFSVFERTASVSGVGALTADAEVIHVKTATASISGVSAMSADGHRLADRTAAISGVSAMSADAHKVVERTATVSGVSAITGDGEKVLGSVTHERTGTIVGTSYLTATSTPIIPTLKRWDGSAWTKAVLKHGTSLPVVDWNKIS